MRAKPYAKFVDIYGTQGIVHADLVREICTIHRTRRLPKMIAKVAFSTETALQISRETVSNTVKVLLRRMKPYAGLRNLVRAFYESIEDRREQPSPGEEGRRMVRVMEMVWAQAQTKNSALTARAAWELKEGAPRLEPRGQAERAVRGVGFGGPVVVTGATGFLGHRLVERLWRGGVDVVALVRDPELVSPALQSQARLLRGDVRDPASLKTAMRDARVVFHCAAITSNGVPWQVHHEVNVLGTQAVLEAALATHVKRVVHVSSVVVYGLGRRVHGPVAETAGYARRVDGWANYMRSKLEADRLAFTFGRESGLAITVVRPGILYGPGGAREVCRGLLQMGPLRTLPGSGHNHLPYTYVDNAVDGLLLAALCPSAAGQAYNIVDEPQRTVREVARLSARVAGESVILVPSPAFLLLALARLLELKCRFHGTRVPPRLTRYVVNSAIRDIRYDTSKAQKELGWQPTVSIEEGLRRTVVPSETLRRVPVLASIPEPRI
jgi:nucleoside-diphosphate-sugar epimerase